MRQAITTVRPRLVALLLAATPLAASADDAADIRHLMMATFDKPEAPLLVDPVTVQGDLAVAGWAQGDMGGRCSAARTVPGSFRSAPARRCVSRTDSRSSG